MKIISKNYDISRSCGSYIPRFLDLWLVTVHITCWLDYIDRTTIHSRHNLCQPTLQWRHNGSDGVSNHQPHDCLLNRLFRRRSKKASKLRVTGLCVGNSPGTGEFPAQMASNAENVSIWWRHHEGTQLTESYHLIDTNIKHVQSNYSSNFLKGMDSTQIVLFILTILADSSIPLGWEHARLAR